MDLILIGTENSKRTAYFRKAAQEQQIPLLVLEWDNVDEAIRDGRLEGAAVKIDPPSYYTFELSTMKEKIKEYQQRLRKLENVNCTFLNSPESIAAVLDKRECKLRMQAQDIPVTQMLTGNVQSLEQLISFMEKKRIFSVFLKPTFFSGAAGVIAFRMHPLSKKMVVYTSCYLTDGKLTNTKTLYYMEDQKEIMALVDAILKLDVIVERWYPKSRFQGKSFDLRAVYQFGHIAHMVVRQSDGPVTNLHLNNQALDIGEITLDEAVMGDLEVICRDAVNLFQGLAVAGIDILLEKNTGKPYIIELNGQGDLIYQDIYADNRIYREQLKELLRLGKSPTMPPKWSSLEHLKVGEEKGCRKQI